MSWWRPSASQMTHLQKQVRGGDMKTGNIVMMVVPSLIAFLLAHIPRWKRREETPRGKSDV